MRRIFEARHAYQHLDVVARKLRLSNVDFGLDHVPQPEPQVRHRDPFLHAVVHSIDGLVVVPGEMQPRLAHCLRRNGSRADARAAHHLAHLPQRDLLTQLCCVDRGPLPSRAGPDDDQIVNATHSGTYSWTSPPESGLTPVPLSAQTLLLVSASFLDVWRIHLAILKLPHQRRRLYRWALKTYTWDTMIRYAITSRALYTGGDEVQKAALLRQASRWAADSIDFIQLREKDLPPAEIAALARALL